MPRKILILHAHPTPRASAANTALATAARRAEGVTVVDLYAEYPRFDVNKTREQARLRAHDALVFQFPLYFYSTPALLKEWQDTVFEHNFAYGDDGNTLADMPFFCAVTTGGPEAAFRADAGGHVSLRELLSPLQQTATLCGMRWLPPFTLYSARRAVTDDRIKTHQAQWLALLEALRDDTLDIDSARRAGRLNTVAAALLRRSQRGENAA